MQFRQFRHHPAQSSKESRSPEFVRTCEGQLLLTGEWYRLMCQCCQYR